MATWPRDLDPYIAPQLERSALLVIDAQVDFADGGAAPVAGCNYPNCPHAALYGASERDYRVLIASDAISAIRGQHLEEPGLMGAVHAPAASIAGRLGAAVSD